jgi:hypothetical protein
MNDVVVTRLCPQCRLPGVNPKRDVYPELKEWLIHFDCQSSDCDGWSACTVCDPTIPVGPRLQLMKCCFKNRKERQNHGITKAHRKALMEDILLRRGDIDDGRDGTSVFEILEEDELTTNEPIVNGISDNSHAAFTHATMDFSRKEHVEMLTRLFENEKTLNFFCADSTEERGGAEFLMQQAIHHTTSSTNQQYYMSPIDCALNAVQAKLAAELTVRQQNLVQDMIILMDAKVKDDSERKKKRKKEVIRDGGVQQSSSSQKRWRETSLPLSYAEFRRRYTDSMTSVHNNLPLPNLVVTEDGTHARASLGSAFAVALGLGVPIAFVDISNAPADNFEGSVTSIFESKRVRHIWRDLPQDFKDAGGKLRLFSFWSDSAETNNTKQNRNSSAWVAQAYLLSPEGAISNRNSVPFAAGPYSESHDEVLKLYYEEAKHLETTTTYFYNGVSRKLEPTRWFNLCKLQDRPEKCANDGVLSLGTNTLRTGLNTDAGSNMDILGSCDTCRKKRKMEPTWDCGDDSPESELCSNCCNWNFLDKKLLTEVPKGYPSTDVDDVITNINGKRCLPPKKLNFPSMLKMVDRARTHRSVGPRHANFWTKSAATLFLKRTEGINEATIDRALDIEVDFVPPPAWLQNDPIVRSPDAPMHLLFLGVEKALIISMIGAWLTRVRAFAPFARKLRKRSAILEGERLEYCKVVDPGTSGKYGGYVSENWLGTSRTSKWYFGVLLEEMGASDKAGNPAAARNLIPASLCMISRAMQKVVNPDLPKQVQRYTKLFLDVVSEFDEGELEAVASASQAEAATASATVASNRSEDAQPVIRRPAKKKQRTDEFVKTKGVLTNCLNQKETIEEYGSQRNIWEGGDGGEGIFRRLKPLVHNMRKNWHVNLLTRFYEQEAMKYVEKETEHVLLDLLKGKVRQESPRRYRLFREFVDKAQVESYINERRPIAGILYGNLFLVAVGKGDDRAFFSLRFDDAAGSTFAQCWFAPVTLSEESVAKELVDETRFQEYVLLLPRHLPGSQVVVHAGGYYTITSEWRERLQDGLVRLSTLEGVSN